MKLVKSIFKRILPENTLNIVKKHFVPHKMNENDMQSLVHLSLLLRAQNDQKGAENIIHKILVGRFEDAPGLPIGFIEQFLMAVESMQNASETRDGVREAFIEHVLNIDPQCLTCNGWLNLYNLVFRNGLVRGAYFIRKKAAERACNDAKEKPSNEHTLFLAFKIAIDNADFSSAHDFLDKLKKANYNETETEESEAYYSLNSGNIQNIQTIWSKKMTHENELFLNYIEGKSVAIVGPSASEDDVGEEIDSFDVVVRTNYRGRKHMPDPRKYGKKLNISYYNGEDSSYINTQKHSFFHELDYAVFKKNQFDIQKSIIDSNKGREMYLIGSHFWSGSATIIPLILFDIYHFRPSRVKLFNLNIHLSKKEYNTLYRENVDHNDLRYRLRSFAHHDILSSFNFYKNLWRSGMIEADRACSDVLNLSAENYMSGLEEIYTEAKQNN